MEVIYIFGDYIIFIADTKLRKCLSILKNVMHRNQNAITLKASQDKNSTQSMTI